MEKQVKKQFKDSQGRWFTTGLFFELADNVDFAIYKLEDSKKNYIDCEDVTGYEFAINYLGGWRHWLTMKNSPTMGEVIGEWEEELEIKLRSRAIKQISELAKTDKGYQSAKFLADRGWSTRQAGKPSKEEVRKEARIQSKLYEEFGNVVELKKST